MLKYSTYKNLAQLAAQREDLETAMEFYLEVRPRPCSPPLVFLKVLGGGGEVGSYWLKRIRLFIC